MSEGVAHAAVESADYRACGDVAARGGTVPRSFDAASADREKLRLLIGTAAYVTYPKKVRSEQPRAECAADVIWALDILALTATVAMCNALGLFDAGALCGRQPPQEGGTVPRREALLRIRERSGRSATGCFVAGTEVYLPLECVKKRPLAPRVPNGWNSMFEVPYGLKVGAPLPARIWGLQMLETPFSIELRDKKPWEWALWFAAHAHFVQDVAAEFLNSLGHCHLFFLP